MTLKMWTHTILTLLFLNFDWTASPEFSSLQIWEDDSALARYARWSMEMRCSSKRNWNFCESLEQLIVIELEVLLDRTWIDKDRVSVHYFLCHSVFFVLQYLKLFCAERVRPIRRRKQGLKRSFQETHSNPMHRTKSLFAYAASRTSTLLCVSIFDMLTKKKTFSKWQ